jgi:hypothetical protein
MMFSATAHAGDMTEAGLRAQLDVLNRELVRLASFSPDPAQFTELLDTRARLLVELMALDPLEVGELSLPPPVVALASREGAGMAVEQSGEWTGRLETADVDDPAHGRSRNDWYLWTGGRQLALHFAYTPHRRAGAVVKVSCLAVAGQVAVSAMISEPPKPAVDAAPRCNTTGPQNIAVLGHGRKARVNYKDLLQESGSQGLRDLEGGANYGLRQVGFQSVCILAIRGPIQFVPRRERKSHELDLEIGHGWTRMHTDPNCLAIFRTLH